MSGSTNAFFDYLEERPFGASSGKRRRNVRAVDDPVGTPDRIPHYRASMYAAYYGYALEGRESLAETEGAWLLTAFRVNRHVGDPGAERWPYVYHENPSAGDPGSLLPRARFHHYFRVLSSADCLKVVRSPGTVNLAIEVTEEWHDPPSGIISAIPQSSPVLGSHAVAVVGLHPKSRMLVFPNSWGEEWGERGWGMIAPELIDRYLVESWAMVGIGWCPPLKTKSGLVVVAWKSSNGGQEVHGREIVDAASGERLGWCFLVRRGNVLDIEELFVWPTYRGHGYGRVLANLARELASQMRIELRALISYADAAPANRPILIRTMELLGLHLHPSTIKSVAFIGLQEPHPGLLVEPSIPEHPATVHARLAPASGTRQYSVWFGTNRKPHDPDDLGKGFSAHRDDQIHYGLCKVSIPKSHRFGSVGSTWWKRWLRLTDDRLRVTERLGLQMDAFWSDISTRLQEYDPDERQGLVFLHGYNVDFDEAAIRAAQIGFDLKIPGITAFFSWPSCGTLHGYPADEACVEASEPFIAEFLSNFVNRSGVERVHLIAHSMGNRGLLRALQRLADKLSQQRVMFGQIILAAPDIDATVFASLAELYSGFSQRTTLYASPADRAVGVSRWLHGYPRAGLIPPVTVVPGVDTVEIPRFNAFELLGHGYYAEAEGLLHDIFDLIRRNAPPEDRQRLTPAQTPAGLAYWVMNP